MKKIVFTNYIDILDPNPTFFERKNYGSCYELFDIRDLTKILGSGSTTLNYSKPLFGPHLTIGRCQASALVH